MVRSRPACLPACLSLPCWWTAAGPPHSSTTSARRCSPALPCWLALLLRSPVGTYSGTGARDLASCTACPVGQYNPSQGLGDRTLVGSPINCLACPTGSLALKGDLTADIATDQSNLTTGSTFCDAW